MNERAAWRILLGQIMALPHYRQQLLTSLQEEFPSFTPADEEKEEEYAEGAILQLLQLSGTGPAARLDCQFAPRLNLLTGDNGLGKTFVLECAWWALTGSWAGYPARSRRDVGVPSMTFQVGNVGQSERIQATYSWDQLAWNAPARRSVLPGLSLFSRSDGSFVAWDPAKYLLGKKERSAGIEPALTRFSLSQMWDGVREQEEDGGRQKVLCNGLIDDWVRWQEAADQTRFEKLSAALQALSPDLDEEPLVPGRPTRMLELGDRRDIPTLQFPYGEVPILLCSAGIQRIVALAYLLVWAWQEHVKKPRAWPESQSVALSCSLTKWRRTCTLAGNA